MSDPRPTRSDRTPGAPRWRRLAALVGLLVGLTLMGTVGAPSAFAHTELDSSNPADGGTVDQPPTSIQLVFAGTVRGADPVFTITVAGAAPVEAPAVIDGATVTADLTGVNLPAATYPATWQVGYRLVALDGDAFRGDITFTVAAGPAPATSVTPETTAPATTAGPSSDTPVTATEPTTATSTSSSSSASSSASVSVSEPGSSVPASSTTGSSATPTTGTAPTVAGTDGGSGSGWWWFAAVVVVVLIAGGGYWYARSRRTAPPAV